MEPRFEIISQKTFVGMRVQMSFTNNKTFKLWNSFMPRRKEIENTKGSELYSIEVYNSHFFEQFNPKNEFNKWAAVEVTDCSNLPNEMETLTIPQGLYAVFIHKGSASTGSKTYHYIFENWLPKSEYTVDCRPHFAIMGDKYKHEDPSSEEEIWIPIKEIIQKKIQ